MNTPTSELLNEAFTSLRNIDNTPSTPHNAIIRENADNIEDEATDYLSDDDESIDIDLLIDMMNSGESTIDSESDDSDNESDYGFDNTDQS